MSACQCPASMCPLIAKDGSPWTGQKDTPCPEQDDIDNDGGRLLSGDPDTGKDRAGYC